MTTPTELTEMFRYHPPQSQERIDKHDAVNQAALTFALILRQSIENEEFLKQAIFAIQQARMLANQAITLDEILPQMGEDH